MSIQLSRRDFMKCSAVAVLAAASGTLLTGCSGGGSGVIITPNQEFTTPSGLSVKMHTFGRPTIKIPSINDSEYNNVIALGDKIEIFEISFDLKNNGNTPIPVIDKPNVAIGKVVTAIGQCLITTPPSYKPLQECLKDNHSFTVRTDKGEKVGCVHFFEKDNWYDDLTNLAPGKKIEVHLLCVAPAGWKRLDIAYNKLGLNFVQSRN